MISNKPSINSIDEYIAAFPLDIQSLLQEFRATVMKAAPNAIEKISYKMPAFYQNGILVYFAAFKNHIGFYPTAHATKVFCKELSVYKGGKGSIQFPLDKPLPLKLIRKIVKFRVKENAARG